ncbi:MAG: hypothetical protein ACYDDO_00765 [Acidiferrobacterales bacterium]
MITWIAFWPFLALPSLLMIGIGGLVSVTVYGRLVGGMIVRRWCIEHLMILWLPPHAGARLEAWVNQAKFAHEWILYVAIAINVNAVLLPILYIVGEGIVRFHGWRVRKDLDLKRSALKAR